jgi:ferredoxin
MQKVYDDLADWLCTTFRAQPGIKGPEFDAILKHLYTPEEAKLAVDMGHFGGKIDALTEKLGLTKDQLLPLIQSMEEKGTMYREPGCEDPLYRPIGMEALGLVETVGWGDITSPFKKKLNELWSEFKPVYVGEGIAAVGKVLKAWCHVEALPEDAVPEENLFEQLKILNGDNPSIAVSNCPCRIMDQHGKEAEKVCDCDIECCFCFGDMARWAVENGWARALTMDECIDILKKVEETGLVHTGIPNLIICNCCKHACINFVAQKLDKEHSYMKNHFFAASDPERCISCNACADRCPVDAIQYEPEAVIDQGKCLGCGSCATGCTEGAIKMNRKSEEEIVTLDAENLKSEGTGLSKVVMNWGH